MKTVSGLVIILSMILAASFGATDIFILIAGAIFIVYGIANIIEYRKTGEMIESLRYYANLRGRKSALFMGGATFVIFIIFYLVFLFSQLISFFQT